LLGIPKQVLLDGWTTLDLIQYPIEELKSLHGTNSSFEHVRVGVRASVKFDGVMDGVKGNHVIICSRFTIIC
jgi:hypothetical protein